MVGGLVGFPASENEGMLSMKFKELACTMRKYLTCLLFTQRKCRCNNKENSAQVNIINNTFQGR